ncbi:MAG: CapA family protein [Elusimicrobiota bacterium]
MKKKPGIGRIYVRFLTAFFFIVFAGSFCRADEKVSILFTGDVYLGGHSEKLLIKDPHYPYLEVRGILEKADVIIGNLESPLTSSEEVFMEKTFKLKASTGVIHSLKAGGFSAVSLANNHIMDFGWQGLKDTIETLEKHGIKYAGAGANLSEARTPAVIETSSISIAFLAYNNTFPLEFNAKEDSPGAARGRTEYFRKDISEASKENDLVIVSFHWSGEYVEKPRQYQEDFGRIAIDSGADIVFGHHPHTMQGIEFYSDSLIAYSLGNYVFGSYSDRARASIMLRVEATSSGIENVFVYPINVNNFEVKFQSKPFKGAEAGEVLGKLNELSGIYGTSILDNEDVGLVRPRKY